MKTALLALLLLTSCASVPKVDARCEAGGGCMTMTKAQLIKALQEAWNDGWAKGYDTGEDNAPPTCKRWI